MHKGSAILFLFLSLMHNVFMKLFLSSHLSFQKEKSSLSYFAFVAFPVYSERSYLFPVLCVYLVLSVAFFFPGYSLFATRSIFALLKIILITQLCKTVTGCAITVLQNTHLGIPFQCIYNVQVFLASDSATLHYRSILYSLLKLGS